MHYLIAGASGFLGSHLVDAVRRDGDTVTRLTRSDAGAPDTTRWDPYGGGLDQELVERADVVVNLAGSPTAGNPHSKKWAHELEESRVTTTRVLAEAVAASDRKPALLAGNGISFYGDRGEVLLDESADSHGDALLTRVTRVWQSAAQPAVDAGARTVFLRTAPVLDRRSPPMKQLFLLFKTGLAGKLGNGRQYFPCITTRDWVAAVRHLAHSEVAGPANLCLPETPTNAEFTRAVASEVHRPAVVPVPSFVLRPAAGQMGPELLNSVRASPALLLGDGFTFADADVAAAVRQAARPD